MGLEPQTSLLDTSTVTITPQCLVLSRAEFFFSHTGICDSCMAIKFIKPAKQTKAITYSPGLTEPSIKLIALFHYFLSHLYLCRLCLFMCSVTKNLCININNTIHIISVNKYMFVPVNNVHLGVLIRVYSTILKWLITCSVALLTSSLTDLKLQQAKHYD